MATQFVAENIVVGPGNLLTRAASGMGTGTVASTGSSTTQVVLSVTADALKFTPGDIIKVGTGTFAQVDSISGVTLKLTGAVTAPSSGDAVVQRWRNLGASDGGITLSIQIEKTLQSVDQSIFSVAAVNTKGSATIEANLADPNMQNLELLTSQAVGTMTNDGTYDTLAIGAGTDNREDEYLILGPGVSGKKRTYYVPRGVSMTTAQLKNSKTDKQLLQAKFEALFSSSINNVGKIYEGAAFNLTV